MCPDNNNEVDDQPVTALEQDVQLEPTETTYQPEEEAEQSTGASLKNTSIQQNMSKDVANFYFLDKTMTHTTAKWMLIKQAHSAPVE